jgi:sugar lactone lactonase YvrE
MSLRIAAVALGGLLAMDAARSAPAEIAIPGQRVFPESITSSGGRLFVGSIAHREILEVEPGASTATPWVAADDATGVGVYGVFADDRSRTLWACFSEFPGAHGGGSSALKAFDLASGAVKARYVLPGHDAFCNDIAVGPDGSVYVTDTNNMQIDRLPRAAASLEVWAGNGAFGPSGGILDGISVLEGRVIVNTLTTSKIFAVPIGPGGNAASISEVKLNRPILEPDGMRAFDTDSVLLVESGGPGRLSKLTIHGNTGEVATLKDGYPQGPVSVTVLGTTAYVVEGQLNLLFDKGTENRPTQPFHATAVAVGAP